MSDDVWPQVADDEVSDPGIDVLAGLYPSVARLRAVVEEARVIVAGIDFERPDGVMVPVPINRLADLFACTVAALDVDGEAT